MNKDLIKYIKNGIEIKKFDSGYSVFTEETKLFKIDSLDELDENMFEAMIKKNKKTKVDNRNSCKLMWIER